MYSTNKCLNCDVHDLGNTDGWDDVESAIKGGTRVFGEFTVIDWFFDPSPYDDSYYEFPQGHEGILYIIFHHEGEDRYFRKSGEGDSYGNHKWDGNVKEVYPTKVVKTVYEYTEKP